MRSLLQEKKINFKEAEGEAAFYGPKIDIMAVDALGREWQISTVQLDFIQPSRFKLEYTAQDGTKATPVMIHRALIGSPDRFMGILIEHYGGAFPTWLAPVQVRMLPVSDKHLDYAYEVLKTLKASNVRTDIDEASESLGKKIRNAKQEKIPYLLIVGDKEVEDKTITIESRDRGNEGAVTVDAFALTVIEEIKNRA